MTRHVVGADIFSISLVSYALPPIKIHKKFGMAAIRTVAVVFVVCLVVVVALLEDQQNLIGPAVMRALCLLPISVTCQYDIDRYNCISVLCRWLSCLVTLCLSIPLCCNVICFYP